ncbi:MAG: ATP-grasp domain-containing protein [Parcubacteria group bacterium]|jgi:hypothetical protein
MIIILGIASHDFMEYLSTRSIPYIICVTTEKEREKMSLYQNIFLVDIRSKNQFLHTLRTINFSAQPVAIITFYERYVIARSWLGNFLGIPTITITSAKMAIDKILMRKALTAYDPTMTPKYKIINNINDVKRFAKKIGFPLMIKPANLQKSLLVTKVLSNDHLVASYNFIKKTITSIYNKEHRTQKPRILMEEFLRGSMHSVQTFAQKNGHVTVFGDPVDLFVAKDRDIEDHHIFARISPSILSIKKIAKLNHVAKKATRALAFTNTPGHVELIYTKKGPMVVEIGPRVGGYRTRLYHMSQGLDLNAALIANAQGKKIFQKNKKCIYTAVIELFPKNDGGFKKITHLQVLKKLSSYHYHSIKAIPSQKVGLAKNGYRTACVIIIKNAHKDQFLQDFTFIRDHMHVITI